MCRTRSMIALVLVAAMSLFIAPVNANEDTPGKLLTNADTVLKQSVSAPDKGIPRELLERAECVGVFPDLKKGAFIVGGEFGRGVFTCRGKDGTMGSPAFYSMGGPSIGWQFGG